MSLLECESAVLACVESYEKEFTGLCSRLVRTNTVNPYAGESSCGSEAAGQDIIEDTLRRLTPQPAIERFDPPDDVYERAGFIGPKGRNFRGRPNVTADWIFGDAGDDSPSLILNDHIDTVGVAGMTIDPFSGDIRDGKVWGRGSTDTKGGLVTGLWAIRALLESGAPLRGKLSFESVVDEECNGSGAGTLACRLKGRRADEAIVLDGDANVVHGCDGVVTVDIRVHGRAGHAGVADSGVNAIEKACLVKQGFDAWKQERLKYYPIPPNLGVFHAGTIPAVIPGEAFLSLNAVYGRRDAEEAFRAGYKHTGEPLYQGLIRHIRDVETRDDWLREHPSDIVWVKDLPPYRIAPDHALVRDLTRAHEDAAGTRPRVGVMSGWCDAAHFAHQSGMPVVMFGTGAGCAHADSEWVEIETMRNNAKTLALFLLRRLAVRL